jgi:alpha-galactosidase
VTLVEWRPEDRQWHLANGRLSLVLGVHDDGSLGLLHLGAPLATGRSYRHLVPRGWAGFSNRLGDPVALEVATPGSGDYRVPALVLEDADGSSVLALRYREHRIAGGKPDLGALPATYVETDDEAATLEIDLADERSGLVVTVVWTIFRDRPVLARSVRLRNDGDARLDVRTVMSLSLDLPDSDWVLVHLAGAWAR